METWIDICGVSYDVQIAAGCTRSTLYLVEYIRMLEGYALLLWVSGDLCCPTHKLSVYVQLANTYNVSKLTLLMDINPRLAFCYASYYV